MAFLRSLTAPRSFHYSFESSLYEKCYFSHCPCCDKQQFEQPRHRAICKPTLHFCRFCPRAHCNFCSRVDCLALGLARIITLCSVFLLVSMRPRGEGHVVPALSLLPEPGLVVAIRDSPHPVPGSPSACLSAHCGWPGWILGCWGESERQSPCPQGARSPLQSSSPR